jgi:hypothetical protein
LNGEIKYPKYHNASLDFTIILGTANPARIIVETMIETAIERTVVGDLQNEAIARPQARLINMMINDEYKNPIQSTCDKTILNDGMLMPVGGTVGIDVTGPLFQYLRNIKQVIIVITTTDINMTKK